VKPEQPTRCGYVAIVGRPNVGKSTLLNHLLGQKISITSRKPQTTRHNVLGIHTENGVQTIYVDTPGQHSDQSGKALNRYLNRAATSAMADVDVVLFLLDRLQWTEEDQRIASRLPNLHSQVIVVINKIDQIKNKNELLPHLQLIANEIPQREIIPVSALHNDNLDRLKTLIANHLPSAPLMFDESQVTDRSLRFLCAEIIREKITRQLGDELPYAVTVAIERFDDKQSTCFIDAVIWVERDGQKSIVVGDQGSRIKLIGQQARPEIEKLVEKKVMLTLWAKVKSGWSDDERALRSLGYDDGV
jgi:GTP-binding protein Era